jgi:hypothetical protein
LSHAMAREVVFRHATMTSGIASTKTAEDATSVRTRQPLSISTESEIS